MGIGGIDTRRWKETVEARGLAYKGPEIPEIPILPDISVGGPTFVVKEGNKTSSALATLEQIHDLYRKEGESMKREFEARVAARAERKAFLQANPPKPEDVKISYWKKTQPKRETESK
jgi:hypothetical protein